MNKSISKLCLFLLIAFSYGCSNIEVLKPIEGNNCVDYIIKSEKPGDRRAYGKFLPSPKGEMHVWLERNGTCYDNMNKSGFDCSDSRYVEWKFFDINDPDNFAKIYNTRG